MDKEKYDKEIARVSNGIGRDDDRGYFLFGVETAESEMNFGVLWESCESECDRWDMMREIMKKMTFNELSWFIREALSDMFNHEIDGVVPQSYKDYLKEQ